MEHYLSSQKTQLYVMYIQACFVLLHFADFCIVHKLKVCDNSASSNSINIIFPTVFTHFVSLCHTLLIFTIFWIFHYYYFCYGDVCYLWCYYWEKIMACWSFRLWSVFFNKNFFLIKVCTSGFFFTYNAIAHLIN